MIPKPLARPRDRSRPIARAPSPTPARLPQAPSCSYVPQARNAPGPFTVVSPSIMPPMLLRLLPPLAVVASLFAVGCSTAYIPNTDVEDTDENRTLIEFCEKYRKAVERKDIATLVAMASADEYYEDGGNADASDDIDFDGLKDHLVNRFRDAKAIRYEIRYRRVSADEKRIFVEYTFSASFKIPGPNGDEWQRKVEDNRLELVPHDDSFLITAGM